MKIAPIYAHNVQEALEALSARGFSDTAIARFIDCTPQTIACIRLGKQSGRNIARRLSIMLQAYNRCRMT